MRMSLWKPLGQALVAAFVFLGAGSATAQAPAKPLVEAFFESAVFGEAKLSPTGRYLSVKLKPRQGRTQLLVLNTGTLAAKMVAGYADVNIGSVAWVTDDRLVFTLADPSMPPGSLLSEGGLYTVSADGSKVEEILGRDKFAGTVFAPRHKSSADFFALPWQSNDSTVHLFRMNAVKGAKDGKIYKGPASVTQWFLDHNDEPRLTVGSEENMSVVRYADPAGQWREVARFPSAGPGGYTVIGFGPDGALYVAATNGKDKAALHKFDLPANRLEPEPVLALTDFDFAGSLILDSSETLLGVRYWSDAPSTHWFDARLKQIQTKVDALLPGTSNLLDVPLRSQVPIVLVHSVSDANPGTYSLFNTSTGTLVPVGQSMRDIDAAQMGTKDLHRYKARDGRDIPLWLALPKGAGKADKLPAVVLVHDGPWQRGAYWSWDAQSQFLASRGYAVLFPEFRGSTGYGQKHYQAGWKQWGLAMQDDIADAVKWAVARGTVDPSRVCIMGRGYGGYAALMGLAKDPDVYRCGIAWSAVAGIDALLETGPNVYKSIDMPLLVADPVQDAGQIARTSPLQNAHRIKQPVFLAHGSSNRSVPIRPSVRLRDAIRRDNPNVEWVEYADEGHEWHLTKNRVDFWTRVEKFLERHIGPK
jgi:dipeptidyl aminopeptidase/acylaminoacyl peptidase